MFRPLRLARALRRTAFLLLLPPLGVAAPAAADTVVGALDKILFFYNFDDGNATPHRVITGSKTGLGSVVDVVVDRVNRELWSLDLNHSEILVFDLDAEGNVEPLRRIDAAALTSPRSLAIDLAHDEIYVADFQSDSVFVFPRTQDGSAAPVRTLTGAATGIDGPTQVYLDLVHDELYVANVFVAARVAVFDRATANGDVAPIRALGAPGSGIGNPRGLHVDLKTDRLLVVEYDLYKIRAYSRLATGATPFLAEIAGGSTELDKPFHLVYTVFDELIVGTDMNVNPRVLAFTAGLSGDVPPARVLVGAATGLSNPTGVASDYARNCSWGNSVDGCVHRDNFESGELCYWNPVAGGAGCP